MLVVVGGCVGSWEDVVLVVVGGCFGSWEEVEGEEKSLHQEGPGCMRN